MSAWLWERWWRSLLCVAGYWWTQAEIDRENPYIRKPMP